MTLQVQLPGRDAPESPGRDVISVGFHLLDELFDGLDPAPMKERDLDADAEEYIVRWARELGHGRNYDLRIHLPEGQRSRDPGAVAGPAIRRYFAYKAEMTRLDLRRLLREGRLALLIGLLFLVSCEATSEIIRTYSAPPQGPLVRMLENGLVIIGWVAMWKPLELFLYEWWPILAKRRVYERLANAAVHVCFDPAR